MNNVDEFLKELDGRGQFQWVAEEYKIESE